MVKKGRILFIENEPRFLAVRSELLELEGYEVVPASSLFEAEQILSRKEFPIHLIVTDLRVTNDDDERDHSGLWFAKRVAPTIPKIIITGFPAIDAVREALDPRFDGLPPAIDFLAKYEGPQRFLDAVERAFETYVKINAPQVKVGGALTMQDAASYVERQVEQELVNCLKSMDYVLVIEPRQQGKTSLINYVMRYARLANTIIIYIDATTLDRSTQENWYGSIYTRLLNQLKLNDIKINISSLQTNITGWREILYTLANFGKAHGKNIVIALDETGTVPVSYATDFFSVMRDVYNSRQAEPVFHHLTFLLVGTFHPRNLIADEKFSPFNIAKRIRLLDFKQGEFNHLLSSMGWSDEKVNSIADRIYYWAGGQPYLTQKLCEYLRFDTTIQDIDKNVGILRREDDNHFPSIFHSLREDKQAQEYIKRILSGEEITFFPAVDQQQADLELLGVIKADDHGNCMIRNRIYEHALLAFFKLAASRNTEINNYETKVFVSYAWGGESERIVSELEQAFVKHNLRIARDKKELDYKGSIEAFEQRIGRGQCIVLVISDKFLRSKHCMYELMLIDQNKNLRERIFPIVLADARIYDAMDQLGYIKHWEEQITQLNQAIKKVDVMTNMDGINADLNKYARIRASLDHLADLLSDMNALTPEMHAANGFSTLINAVERAMAKK